VLSLYINLDTLLFSRNKIYHRYFRDD